ncbi:MAG: ABC transporter permease [Candidatus Dormibacteraeota bacterium]|nr:ABC transporter permease [Candidatus Dormibacteraeota bacterium]
MATEPLRMPAYGAGELSVLDKLETTPRPARRFPLQVWRGAWPRLAAVAIALAVWQAVVLSGWRPDYLLPGPVPVLRRLAADLTQPVFYGAMAITLERALWGFGLAIALGSVVGAVVARNRVLRAAVGSLITGLQSMPSIAWFPLAILLFGLTEGAIGFVVLLGAAPAIANGLISGFDQIPPLLIRSGRAMGASRFQLFRHVLLPASLPAFIGGLKQGWAFAWRSLMAGELLVIISNHPSLGVRLQLARETADAEGLLAAMVVVLAIGMAVEILFSSVDGTVRRRRGLA